MLEEGSNFMSERRLVREQRYPALWHQTENNGMLMEE